MARRLSFLLGLIFLVSLAARGQDKVELFGGYSYERFNSSPSRNLNGWEISGQYKFAGFLGALADVDAHYGSQVRSTSFMIGPQVSVPFRISPFVHVLVGIGHVRAGGISDNSFSTALGGGVDMKLVPTISWRVIQADDVVTRYFGSTQHNARISTGIIFRF
jgi:hypothetical protein